MNPIELGFWIAFWVLIGIPLLATIAVALFAGMAVAVCAIGNLLWPEKKDGPDEA